MRLRCRICRAWRLGDRVIHRTPRTDTCDRCDPTHATETRKADRALALARREAELPGVRRWLQAAPLFDQHLLIDARAAYPGPDHVPDLARRVVPWADTIDLETATDWLYTRIGKHLDVGQLDYPPATDRALCRRFADHHGSGPRYEDTGDSLDLGAVFGQRGFPYPPDTSEGTSDDDVDVTVELVAAEEAWDAWHETNNHIEFVDSIRYRPSQPVGADVLPDHYTDVLTFELSEILFDGEFRNGAVVRDQIRWERSAIGSIYREDADRIVVLWH